MVLWRSGSVEGKDRRASCGNTGTLVQWEPLRPLQMCSSGHPPVVHKHPTSARAKLFEWYPVMGKQRRERCTAYKPKRGKKHLNVRKHIFPARGLILFRRLPGEEAATPTPEGTPASAAPAPGHRRGQPRSATGVGRAAHPRCPRFLPVPAPPARPLPCPRPAGVPRAALAAALRAPGRPRGRCCGSACSPRSVSGGGGASRPPGARPALLGGGGGPGPGAPWPRLVLSLQLYGSPGRPCFRPGRAPSRTAPAATSGTTRICPGRCTAKVRALPLRGQLPRSPSSPALPEPAAGRPQPGVPPLPGVPRGAAAVGFLPPGVLPPDNRQALRGSVCTPPAQVSPQDSAGCLSSLLSFSVFHVLLGKCVFYQDLFLKRPVTSIPFLMHYFPYAFLMHYFLS